MTSYRCPVPYRRVEPDLAGRVTLRALDGSRDMIFAGVTVCRLPQTQAALEIEELRRAGAAGRAILVLRSGGDGDGDGAIEASGWWVHEPMPGLFKDLHAPFQPGLMTRLTAIVLVTLMGVPGMRGAFRLWHSLRTR